ncbi:LysR family transcriptional regulator [Thalassobaculum fulvum]|uniref:LysR family transcriptional regulator n=1 Tax=Thalassobaculum fulvum TaxID=1633335 RepID=A0A918XWB7_9PROT|nr:LysR family transcriptional regulator [Thalassobaculum fulvum]GHD61172.1 LysR family transcriptional regulator [Thalassobaculum fulvum]
MNLKFLETFIWVARLKSFSLAAERLNTTQAAVSHRIATLERELGIRLFERDSRDVRLTPLGIDAREHAERIVRLAADFRRRMINPASLTGTVRIGVIDTVVYSWLPTLIERVREAYPDVVLELNAAITPEISEDILDGRLDLGLMNGPVDAPGLVNRQLCTFACQWVASPALAVPDGPLEIEDVARFPILSFPTSSSRHGSVVGYFQRSGIENIRLHTASLATLIRLTTDGVGLAAIPTVTIEREIASGALRILPVRTEFPAISLYAMYLEMEDRPLPPLIAQMAADCATAFCASRDPADAW